VSAISVKTITWDIISDIWQNQLWPDRPDIETHSAMTWPGDYPDNTHDMSIFLYDVTYWGAYQDSDLVGVNSGHRTSPEHYRSRGLWVDPAHRLQGISKQLFSQTQAQAVSEGCIMIWSLPRMSAIRAYQSAGFVTQGMPIKTQTSNANIYVKKII